MEPLSDQAILIRGGLMEIVTMRVAVDTCVVRYGFYGLSFFGDDGLTVEEIARLAARPNRRIRVSSVGRLRAIGHEPVRAGEFPHLSVRFPVTPTDDELERLAAAFDPDIPNPHMQE